MGFRWLVTVALGLHFSYLAFLVLGGFLAWRWPRAIWLHLAAVGWGVAVIGFGLRCPLTWLENWARHRSGQSAPTAGFVDRYLDNVIYPERFVWLARLAVAVAVGVSWAGVYLRHRARPGAGKSAVTSAGKSAVTSAGKGDDTARQSGEEAGRAATV